MGSYEHTSRELLPLSVIRSACAGDTDAVEQVLRHYRGYINKLCTGILYDKHGQPHVCIDEYMKRHLEIKLISSIVTKPKRADPFHVSGQHLEKYARRTMAVHYRANGYVAVCIEPDGGCATMLFFEKWSDHHHAAMQVRLLAGHDIQTG